MQRKHENGIKKNMNKKHLIFLDGSYLKHNITK